jgi:hypothetical protein
MRGLISTVALEARPAYSPASSCTKAWAPLSLGRTRLAMSASPGQRLDVAVRLLTRAGCRLIAVRA